MFGFSAYFLLLLFFPTILSSTSFLILSVFWCRFMLETPKGLRLLKCQSAYSVPVVEMNRKQCRLVLSMLVAAGKECIKSD